MIANIFLSKIITINNINNNNINFVRKYNQVSVVTWLYLEESFFYRAFNSVSDSAVCSVYTNIIEYFKLIVSNFFFLQNFVSTKSFCNDSPGGNLTFSLLYETEGETRQDLIIYYSTSAFVRVSQNDNSVSIIQKLS